MADIGRYLASAEIVGNVTGTYNFYVEPLNKRITTTNSSIFFDAFGVTGNSQAYADLEV